MNDIKTFESINYWIAQTKLFSDTPNIPILIVGTKNDLENAIDIEEETAKKAIMPLNKMLELAK